MKSSKLQDTAFQAFHCVYKLECACEGLCDENTLLQVENITLQNKVTELEIKLIEVRKSSNNLLKPLLSDILNPHQQKKRGKKRKTEA